MTAPPHDVRERCRRRAAALAELSRDADVAELTSGIAPSSGIEPASVQRLAEMWLESLRNGAIERWTGAMGAGLSDPVPRAGIVAPGNLFVATWTAMLEPWLCGCDVLVRPGSGDPHAAGRLAAALGMGGFEVRAFDRADDRGWARFLGDIDALAVYGGEDAVTAVRAIADRRGFVGPVRDHGHKVTALQIGGDDFHARAEAIAHDALLADGRGCMSLRALAVDGAFELDDAWLDAWKRVAEALPTGRSAPDLAAGRRLYLQRARMQQALGQPVRVVETGDAAVVVDRRRRASIGLADIGPGARVLTVLASAPFDAELGAHLARPEVTADDLGGLQAPPVWRDPDGHPVGRAFLRAPESAASCSEDP